MSPNRLLATTTSNDSGRRTKSIAAASTSKLRDSTPGNSRRTASNARSHRPRPYTCAFDLVMLVRCLRGRSSAARKAARRMRSQPRRVNTPVWIATSFSWSG